MDPLPPASLSEQGENDFQKWGRKTADVTHLPSSLTSEKRGNSFFRKLGKYYLLFTTILLEIASMERLTIRERMNSGRAQYIEKCRREGIKMRRPSSYKKDMESYKLRYKKKSVC